MGIRELFEPYPRLKGALRSAYTLAGYACAGGRGTSVGEAERITPEDGWEYLFGYYDKCPWDGKDERLLALRVRDSARAPAPDAPGELVLIDGERVVPIGTTRAWNVQMGCRAMWLGPDEARWVVYNDFREERYCAVVFDTVTMREERVLPMAVYDVSRDGRFALTLDFSRLHRLRPGYGYANIPDATAGEACPDSACIWRMDMRAGEVRPIFKYTDLAAFEPSPGMAGAEHKVNHLMISPDGRRFMALHRWFEGGHKHTRLLTADCDGGDLCCLADDGFVSHCCWKNDEEILSFLQMPGSGRHYYLLRDRTREYRMLWPGLGRDGHCTYSPDGKYIVTDSYPDRGRMCSVYLCSEADNRAGVLARVFSPLRYQGDCRCDLHPRFSRSGDRICIDSAHEGRRGIYQIRLDPGVIEKRPVPDGPVKPSLRSRIKRNPAAYALASALRRVPDPFISAWMRACHARYGVEGNKVFFSSYDGTLFNDNPKAVAEALHALCPGARIVFRLNRRGMAMDLPPWVEPVEKLSRRTLRELATAKAIVTNAGMQEWMVKFQDQFYVQTWHGDRGFKRVRLDLDPKRTYFVREGRRIDLALAGSEFGANVCRTGLGAKKEVMVLGCPRNDLLVKNPPEVAKAVRERVGIPEGAKVLMYAPTFRDKDSGSAQQADISLESLRKTLERTTGEKWVCVTRSHIAARGIRSDAQRDLSDYPEVTELLLISDMVITDYSSIGGDFMLLGRPVIYYQPDRGAYDGERGLYFDPDQSPLKVAHTPEELEQMLENPFDAAENCRACLDFFKTRETGSSAETVARRIARELTLGR